MERISTKRDKIMAAEHNSIIHYRIGKVIKAIEEKNMYCFSNITYRGIPQSTYKITLYFAKGTVKFSEEEVKQWIEDLNQAGFYARFAGIKNGNIYFEIPVWKKITKRIHLNSTVILIRYLYEMDKLLTIYFEMRKALPDADKFKLIQMVNWFIPYFNDKPGVMYGDRINSNHTIVEQYQSYIKPRTKRELFRDIKKHEATIFKSETISVTNFWGINQMPDIVKIIGLVNNKDYKNLYELI